MVYFIEPLGTSSIETIFKNADVLKKYWADNWKKKSITVTIYQFYLIRLNSLI